MATNGEARAPTVEIAGCRAAHEKLSVTLEPLTEATIRAPSRLPGWTVGHVLAHLARNADSVLRRLLGAIEDRVVDQYAGGPRGRAAEIERSAALSLEVLVADVRTSSAAVDRVVEAVPGQAWERLTRSVSGALAPARLVVYSRWREVEVHLVDLGLGYTPAEWPAALVERWLPEALDGLPGRADQRELLRWISGRGAPPGLAPWA